jgi:hypothetical protein
MRSVCRDSCRLKRNTLLNRSHLACAPVSAASVLLPIARHGDAGTHGPANASVYVYVYPSSMPEVIASGC